MNSLTEGVLDRAVTWLTHHIDPFQNTTKVSPGPGNVSGSSGNHFNIDILENPVPPAGELSEAINLQKHKIQSATDDAVKKREIDILVRLRQKEHELNSTGSDSSTSTDPNPDKELTVLGHRFVRSTELSGYCGKCGGAVYRKLKAAYLCRVCGVILHKTCLNDATRHCALANRDSLKLITKITPSYGLHQQNYSCFDCGTEISYSGSKVYLCDYTGRYYCSDCHKRTPHPIPARMIHNWDFKPRSIALQSAEILRYLETRDYLNVEMLNPGLFKGVPVMAEIRKLRESVILYKAHFVQCSRALKEELCLKLKDRQHFIDTSKWYTLQDLKDAYSETLLPELQVIVAQFEAHYQSCTTCTNTKFYCAVCSEPPLLAPFSKEAVYSMASCPQCHGLMHRACYNSSQSCPHCSSSLLNEN
eukprot:sb/3465073/